VSTEGGRTAPTRTGKEHVSRLPLLWLILGLSACAEVTIPTAWVDCYRDDDGDGWGGEAVPAASGCPDGFVDRTGDCDDAAADVFPGAVERCDGIDDDCDGQVDEEAVDAPEWYADGDGDGVGDATCGLACEPPPGCTAERGDCDDQDPARFPGNLEACDGVDSDCVGDPEELDSDGDGWRGCEGDCDDDDPSQHPADEDGDGQSPCEGDCDDTDPRVWRIAPERWDEVDNDCDGSVDDEIRLSAADVLFVNEYDGDETGHAVAGAGDVDGDGVPDLLIGAPDGGPYWWHQTGKAFLVLGSQLEGGGAFEVVDAHASFEGEQEGDRAGEGVTSIGDITGDGLDDVAIAAPGNSHGAEDGGRVYVFFSETLASSGLFYLADADVILSGLEEGARLGDSLAPVGDVDGDGLPDLLVGATHWWGDAEGPGRAHLFSGSALAAGGEIAASDAHATLLGEGVNDCSGDSVASAGDVDADGVPDLLVGAPWSERAWLALGPWAAAGGVLHLADAHGRVQGTTYTDDTGTSVASAGDVDLDGRADLLVGSPGTLEDTGAVLLFLGVSVGVGGTWETEQADARITGEAIDDRAGQVVAQAGDVDGDGRIDVLVGARRNDEGGSDAGRAYLLLGATLAAGGEIALSDAHVSFMGDGGDRCCGSLAGVGDVDGNGRDDLLVGSPTNWDGAGAFLFLAP